MGEDLFLPYVVKETRMFPREEIKWDETSNSIDSFLEELKEFEEPPEDIWEIPF